MNAWSLMDFLQVERNIIGKHETGNDIKYYILYLGFPSGSAGKECICNAGDTGGLGSTPGLGRSLGGGHGNPSNILAWRNLMDRGAWKATVHRVAESDMTEVTEHAHTILATTCQAICIYYLCMCHEMCIPISM